MIAFYVIFAESLQQFDDSSLYRKHICCFFYWMHCAQNARAMRISLAKSNINQSVFLKRETFLRYQKHLLINEAHKMASSTWMVKQRCLAGQNALKKSLKIRLFWHKQAKWSRSKSTREFFWPLNTYMRKARPKLLCENFFLSLSVKKYKQELRLNFWQTCRRHVIIKWMSFNANWMKVK